MTEKSVAWNTVALIPLLMRNIGADMRCFGGGLAPSHFGLLGMLAQKNYHLSELAEHQAVTPATISNSIATLVEKGYVERVTPVHDRRVVQVKITPAGQKLLSEVHLQLEQHIETLLSALTAVEVQQLDDGIRVLRKVLESATWNNTTRCEERPAAAQPGGSR